MINLLLPIAGRSSRYPNLRPKWSLTHPLGDMMVIEAIKGISMDNVSRIYFIGLAAHNDQLDLVSALSAQLKPKGLLEKAHFILLHQETRNQPETVAIGIRQGGIEGPIYVKDSDNYFCDDPAGENSVACCDLHSLEMINARNKSYLELNGDGYVTNIVEKRIVSSRFCAGGYSFKSARQYLEYFDTLSDEPNLYISNIIFEMILQGVPFGHTEVKDYVDWGTIKEWRAYTQQFATLFVDLDGTLVENSGQYSKKRWGETQGIKANIDAVNHLHSTGKTKIIITTSRTEIFRDATIAQLKALGIKYHLIIFDLPHGKRIVINDYSPSNPFKSCDAINVKRDSGDLKEMLENSMGFQLDISTSEG
jgi:hypothetical protein